MKSFQSLKVTFCNKITKREHDQQLSGDEIPAQYFFSLQLLFSDNVSVCFKRHGKHLNPMASLKCQACKEIL